MAAGFNNFTFVDDDDSLGVSDGRKTMRYNNQGFSGNLLV